MTISARDHSYAINPFLQDFLGRQPQVVYWHRDGTLVDYRDARPALVQLDHRQVEMWCRQHSPDDLWSAWSHSLLGRRFLVEHTSVNPVHPLHVGSLRGTLVGNSLALLLRSAGADVDVRYFVNDLGRQALILRAIADVTDWSQVPGTLRADEAAGVLYALGSMLASHRYDDVRRLTQRHPWTERAVNARALHFPASRDTAAQHWLTGVLLAHAETDMQAVGAQVDRFEYESNLDENYAALSTGLMHDTDSVIINGTRCLRSPAGLVPLTRADGTELYFLRDIANLDRRNQPRTTILQVIGDDQHLPQAILRRVRPATRCEHVAFGMVHRDGRKFSARQNRLVTVHDISTNDGDVALWGLSLAILCRQRRDPIDLVALETGWPVRVVLRARQESLAPDQSRPPLPSGHFTWWRLVTSILRTPGVLQRAARNRASHVTANLLVEMSARYLAAARHGAPPDWMSEWFSTCQARLASLHGLDADALVTVHEAKTPVAAGRSR